MTAQAYTAIPMDGISNKLSKKLPSPLGEGQGVRAWRRNRRDLREHGRTGRPLGSATFLERLETIVGRALTPQKSNRPPKTSQTATMSIVPPELSRPGIVLSVDLCCIGRGVASVRHKQGSRSYTYYGMHTLGERFATFEGEGTVFGSIGGTDLKNIK